MIIFKTATDLSTWLQDARNSGKAIGFVPTMGALHAGHLSLIQRSKQTTEISVCSIFVNPTQFTNPEDFKHYPVTIENDIDMLIRAGCDALFLPGVAEIYPAGYQKKHYDLGVVEAILEGTHRPGHFQGVCQVVDRLLQITTPEHLFLGQKDYQQCLVIARLLFLLGKENTIELHIEPTLREADGLAMSSRNLRLNPHQRQQAVAISKALIALKKAYSNMPSPELIETTTEELQKRGFTVDYVEVRDQKTLTPVTTKEQKAVALIAASIGPVRLIDNLLLN